MSVIRAFVGKNRELSGWFTKRFPSYFIASSYTEELLRRISSCVDSGRIASVLEVGGIDRPLLNVGQGYTYDGLDIEENERCKDVYDHYYVQSIEQPIERKYDAIISITVLEHVPNNIAAVRQMYDALNNGGETHHYIPSKWHPYSLSLRLVGPTVQRILIPILRPGAEGVSGYPAFFNKCSVPAMRRLMKKQGFEEIDIKPYYDATDYFAFFTPLFLMVATFENFCNRFGLDIFASGFIVSAKK